MLPNYLLPLAYWEAESAKVMSDLYLAEAEKSDMTFYCCRPLLSCFFCIFIFPQSTKTIYIVQFLLYVSTCICIFLVNIVYILSITFLFDITQLLLSSLLQHILNSSCSQMPSVPLNNHWEIVMLQLFNTLRSMMMTMFVYRAYFFCQIIFLRVPVTQLPIRKNRVL